MAAEDGAPQGVAGHGHDVAGGAARRTEARDGGYTRKNTGTGAAPAALNTAHLIERRRVGRHGDLQHRVAHEREGRADEGTKAEDHVGDAGEPRPLIVTTSPTRAVGGTMLVGFGGLMTSRLVALRAVPSIVVTLSLPVTAANGTRSRSSWTSSTART
jgi:hypothetical protein